MPAINYNQKEIYDKVFKQKRVGAAYDPDDVDEFLDGIIADYGTFTKRIQDLEKQVAQLQGALREAQEDLAASDQAHVAPAPVVAEPAEPVQEEPAPNSNLDLIKRVANLEAAVFGTKQDN
ncbi:DivIVA domain-containing protein [Leuconostocaceae bacterium ESL0958]|nr:DivIVA domain-containing protein [Leuconostocaceae bacterium ESL0958]